MLEPNATHERVFVHVRRSELRFLLVHADGEPADPPAYLTAIPAWKEGDEFLAGIALRKFRVVAVDEPPSDDFQGLLTVETVD